MQFCCILVRLKQILRLISFSLSIFNTRTSVSLIRDNKCKVSSAVSKEWSKLNHTTQRHNSPEKMAWFDYWTEDCDRLSLILMGLPWYRLRNQTLSNNPTHATDGMGTSDLSEGRKMCLALADMISVSCFLAAIYNAIHTTNMLVPDIQ